MMCGPFLFANPPWKYTRDVSPAQIEPGALHDATATVCYVKDNGVGFNMTYNCKLFKLPIKQIYRLL